MRQRSDARVIKVNKQKLIDKIIENKNNHSAEYEKAVKAYKIEAERQLKKQLADLESGSLKINVNLTSPTNKTDEYDKILSMFKWEEEDIVELSQGEFNEYILDETQFAIQAKFINSTYLSSYGDGNN